MCLEGREKRKKEKKGEGGKKLKLVKCNRTSYHIVSWMMMVPSIHFDEGERNLEKKREGGDVREGQVYDKEGKLRDKS